MRLRTYLLLLSGVLAFVGVVTTLSLKISSNYFKNAADSADHIVKVISMVSEVQSVLLSYHRQIVLSKLADVSEPISQQKAARDRIDYLLVRIDELINNSPDEPTYLKARESIQNYFIAINRINKDDHVEKEFISSISAPFSEAFNILNSLINVNTDQGMNWQSHAQSQSAVVNIFGSALLLFIALSTASVIWAAHYYLYKPLMKTRNSIANFHLKSIAPLKTETGFIELREINHAFNQLVKKLQRQNKTQLQSLAAVAHDLRNPLGAIKMSTELFALDPSLPENERMEIIELIGRQTQQLDRMVGDLLDKSRIEAGELELKMEPINLGQLINDTIQLHKASSQYNFEFEAPASHVKITCDPLRISQVITNLVSNAIKYSPEGGKIKITLKQQPAETTISVKDEGIGISQEEITTIFEPFQRTKASREKSPGVGLGLSVSQKIAAGHGGIIHVESELGLGSIFTLKLPSTKTMIL